MWRLKHLLWLLFSRFVFINLFLASDFIIFVLVQLRYYISGQELFAVTMPTIVVLPVCYCILYCTGGQSSRKFVIRQSELLSKQSLTYQPWKNLTQVLFFTLSLSLKIKKCPPASFVFYQEFDSTPCMMNPTTVQQFVL